MPNISQSKGNQTMKFHQLKECNQRNNFLEKSCRKWGKKSSSKPLSVLQNDLYQVKASSLQLGFNGIQTFLYGQLPPKQVPPWNYPQENYPRTPIAENYPWIMPHWTTTLRTIGPYEIPPGQLRPNYPWIISPWRIVPQKFH